MNYEQHTELLPLGQAGNQFELSLRGYDRGQVNEHLLRLEDDLRVAIADRDIAAARSADLAAQLTAALQARADRLSAEIDAKHREADGYAGRLVGEAEQRATAILAEAEQKAREATADAQREQERRDAEAVARRQQADEDFEIALRARRAEQAAVDEQRRTAVARESEQRLTAARTEADRLVARAREQVEVLRGQRRQVLDHLAGIRRALDGMPSADALESAEQEELERFGAAHSTGPSERPAT